MHKETKIKLNKYHHKKEHNGNKSKKNNTCVFSIIPFFFV